MTAAADATLLTGTANRSGPTVLAAWTATLVRALDAHGIDGMALAREAGIDPSSFTIEDARIPLIRSTELWHLAVDATGDPCFGIEVSRFVRPTTFNALGLGIVASESFRKALDRIVRFASVVLSPSIETAVADEKGRLVYTCHAAPDTPRPSYESIEAIGASIVRAARFLMDRNVSPCEVRLERPEQPASDRFEMFFRCPVRYGADRHRIAFDASVADRLLPTRHADLGSVADRLTAEYVERVQSSGRLTNQVREVVARALADGEPTQRAVAARLAMSCRTMQRRLQEESTTFRDVVADVRIARAKQLMWSERLPTSLIAERLGFSDTAAFRRAFKRRTGMTAGEFSALTR
jgi:AraC-like DNA-binding protein